MKKSSRESNVDDPTALINPDAPDDNDEAEDEQKAIHKAPKYIYIEFGKRPTIGNKFARLVYVSMYSLFCSVWFYFIPFVSIFLSYQIPYVYGPPPLEE